MCIRCIVIGFKKILSPRLVSWRSASRQHLASPTKLQWSITMRFHSLLSIAIPFFLWNLAGAASWGFDGASVSVHSKKAGVGGGAKEKLVESKALPEPIVLGAADTLKLLLTTTEGKKARRPHQAFLLLQDPKSNLDTSFPLIVKESGKGKLELSHKDLPIQFLTGSNILSASLVIASFGASTPYRGPAFDLKIELDPSAPPPSVEKPLRYGKLPEIHHIFKADPKSPPKIISLVFTAAVSAALPALFFGVSALVPALTPSLLTRFSTSGYPWEQT
ncbi:MAG: hypothetical protein Q9197_006861 [Variospora fuerteventurae]